MEISVSTILKSFVGVFFVVVVLAVALVVQRRRHDSELEGLRGEVASRDKTIEAQKDVYEKLAYDNRFVRDLLGTRNEEVVRLKRLLEKRGDELLAAVESSVKWKKAYEAAAEARETRDPATGRVRVDFEKDFGYIGVRGHTLTSPPEAFVRVEQNRPLRLTLVVSQAPTGEWRATVASSEENVSVDVGLAAVDPRVLEPRWYERIGLNASLGAAGLPDFLLGAGATVDVARNFELGPAAWLVASDAGLRLYYGAAVAWRPFRR